MIFITLLSWIIFFLLIYCILLQICIIICSSKGIITDIEKRNYTPKFEQNFTIVVYSHNNASNIINLIETLKKQNYDQNKYSINIILDNCTDESSKLLEILGGTRLWRISTDVKPIGKNKAVGWFLERILSTENTNAFIVIEADCLVKPDFLTIINSEIINKPVLIGEVHNLSNKNSIITNISRLKNYVKNRVIKHGRYYASLHNLLEGNVWAIRQDVLEKVNFVVTDYGFENYEFSINLSKSNISIATSNQIVVYKQINETLHSLALEKCLIRYKAFITLKNNFHLLGSIKSSLKTKEILLSLFYPSSTIILFLILFLLAVSMFSHTNFAVIITYKTIFSLMLVYSTVEAFQFLVARLSFTAYKTVMFSIFFTPIIFIYSIILELKSNFNFRLSLPQKLLNSSNKEIIDSIVSDGKKDLPCKIEIKQSDYYAQAFFIFKEKKLSSSKQSTIDTALNEISEKLKSHGFNLKICLNCNYFKSDDQIITKFSGKQGYCNFDNVHNNSNAKEYTNIWNCCTNFTLSERLNTTGLSYRN